MAENVYKKMCRILEKRGGQYPGKDIPEFYLLVEELFTPEEALVYTAIPKGFHTAKTISEKMGADVEGVSLLLENMADKGLCTAGRAGDETFYMAPPFVPGIFELQFMRGTFRDKDKKLAKLIHNYKSALNDIQGIPEITFPTTRIFPIEKSIQAGNKIHTYHQVLAYIDQYNPISVSTCYCRHAAKLIDPSDDCGKPDEVCLQFGVGAQFIIDRKMGRKISKGEAKEILKKAEDAGLVHASINRQDVDFICNCCKCHCMILETVFAQEKPGKILNSGFKPSWNVNYCTACEACIEICPADALAWEPHDTISANLDRCIGCGVCASECTAEAISLVERGDIVPPPTNQFDLREAVKKSSSL